MNDALQGKAKIVDAGAEYLKQAKIVADFFNAIRSAQGEVPSLKCWVGPEQQLLIDFAGSRHVLTSTFQAGRRNDKFEADYTEVLIDPEAKERWSVNFTGRFFVAGDGSVSRIHSEQKEKEVGTGFILPRDSLAVFYAVASGNWPAPQSA